MTKVSFVHRNTLLWRLWWHKWSKKLKWITGKCSRLSQEPPAPTMMWSQEHESQPSVWALLHCVSSWAGGRREPFNVALLGHVCVLHLGGRLYFSRSVEERVVVTSFFSLRCRVNPTRQRKYFSGDTLSCKCGLSSFEGFPTASYLSWTRGERHLSHSCRNLFNNITIPKT